MQPVSNGIATFSQAIFSGYVGLCNIKFEAYFHDMPNIKAAYEPSSTSTIRVIASSMVLRTQLQMQPLVAGATYNFAGEKIMETKHQ